MLIRPRRNLDYGKLILSVDLWDVTGTREDNCVRHNSSAPSISSSSITSYPVAQQTPQTPQVIHELDPTHLPQSYHDYPIAQAPASVPASPYEPYSSSSNDQQRYNGPSHQNGYGTTFQPQGSAQHRGSLHESMHQASQDMDPATAGMNRNEPSKNLIGQCHTTVQKLKGVDDKTGLFFVFQDLSVRTEGWFRLKCYLFALKGLGFPGEETSPTAERSGLLMEAPNLAAVFSKPFKVFSAKKFPGVVETTKLSQLFAKQGIKIPIRMSEGKGKNKRGAGEDLDMEELDDVHDEDHY